MIQSLDWIIRDTYQYSNEWKHFYFYNGANKAFYFILIINRIKSALKKNIA